MVRIFIFQFHAFPRKPFKEFSRKYNGNGLWAALAMSRLTSFALASVANQPRFDYDADDFDTADELTKALSKCILRQTIDEDDEAEDTVKQLKRKGTPRPSC